MAAKQKYEVEDGAELVAILAESGTGEGKLAVARECLARAEAQERHASSQEVFDAMADSHLVFKGTLDKALAIMETGRPVRSEVAAAAIPIEQVIIARRANGRKRVRIDPPVPLTRQVDSGLTLGAGADVDRSGGDAGPNPPPTATGPESTAPVVASGASIVPGPGSNPTPPPLLSTDRPGFSPVVESGPAKPGVSAPTPAVQTPQQGTPPKPNRGR